MVLIRTFITTPLYCYFLQMHDCMATIAAILVNINALLVQVRTVFLLKKTKNGTLRK